MIKTNKITERRVIVQDWVRYDKSKWEPRGWFFQDGLKMQDDWTVAKILQFDKYGNPTIALAERNVNI